MTKVMLKTADPITPLTPMSSWKSKGKLRLLLKGKVEKWNSEEKFCCVCYPQMDCLVLRCIYANQDGALYSERCWSTQNLL